MNLLQHIADQLASRHLEQLDRDLGYDVIKSSKRIIFGKFAVFIYDRTRTEKLKFPLDIVVSEKAPKSGFIIGNKEFITSLAQEMAPMTMTEAVESLRPVLSWKGKTALKALIDMETMGHL